MWRQKMQVFEGSELINVEIQLTPKSGKQHHPDFKKVLNKNAAEKKFYDILPYRRTKAMYT